MIVVLLAVLPLIPLSNFNLNTEDGVKMLYHISGEFAVRWLVAVLTCTPFFILFGVQNLFVRQAMGISAAIWSFIHFGIFIYVEGFTQTFSETNYIAGFIAVLVLIPLFLTSNRKSIKFLQQNWKKLQKWAYLVIVLSLIHIALLEKTYLVYTIVVGVGFIIRIPVIKNKIRNFRARK